MPVPDGQLPVVLPCVYLRGLIHRVSVVPDSAIRSYADLKGKRIGVTSPGSFTDNTVRWAIAKAGLKAERDFQIVAAGGGAAMRAAIDTGQIDAGTVVSTEVSEYLRSGKFKIVTDWRTAEVG